jgi:hypothetical protein
MNAIVAIQTPKPPKSETYAKARSQCVDGFARLELAVISLSNRLGIVVAQRALIGQRLKKLREPENVAKLTSGTSLDCSKLYDLVEQLLHERTDIVHSEMVIVSTETATMAIFQNSADIAAARPEARIYSLSALKTLGQSARELAGRLDALKLKPT